MTEQPNLGFKYNISPIAPVNPDLENEEKKPDLGFKFSIANEEAFGPKHQSPLSVPPAVSVDSGESPVWKLDKKLSKEDILNNPQYIAIVRKSMKTRFGVENRMALALDQKYKEDYNDEEMFEAWQNWNRSFAGGQTVTTAAEVTFHQNAKDDDKKIIGQSYLLFDNMNSIWDGDTSWREMGDGMFDYARAAIWDPTTAAGFGVGRLWGALGTKASSQLVKQEAKRAYIREISKGTAKEAAKVKARKVGKLAFVKAGAIDSSKLFALDLASAVGADAGYQYSHMSADVQERYSKLQGGLSALGAIALPALVGGVRGLKAIGDMEGADKLGIQNYVKIHEELKSQMTPQNITKSVVSRVDPDIIQAELGILGGDMKRVIKEMGKFTDDVGEAATSLRRSSTPLDISDSKAIFWDTLFFGDSDLGVKGLISSLQEAGVVYIPRGADDNVTNFIGDILKELPKEYSDNITKVLDEALTDHPNFLPEGFDTASMESVGNYFKHMTSNAGRTLANMGVAARRLNSKKPVTVKEVLKGISKDTSDEAEKHRLRYAQSVYKRLLTSHPGTTGLNIKGWSVTLAANTVSDLVAGVILAGTGNFQKAGGSILGSMRRGYNVLNHIDTLEAADSYFKVRPEMQQKIHQFITGGVDQAGTQKEMFERFGLDPDSVFNKRTESFTNFWQTVSGVKIQDEVTKQLSFISALDQEVMKAYGKNYNQFMLEQNAFTNMFSPEFQRVEAKALERTLRETYSMPQNQTRAYTPIISDIAAGIEKFSHAPGGGLLVPFGQFFNNATATLGDYSMINFFRYMAVKNGNKTDIDGDDLAQLAAKGAVGWAAMTSYFIPNAQEKRDDGLRWNQERRSDGSIADMTYDAPLAYGLALGSLLSYVSNGEEIPQDVFDETMAIVGGQLTRDVSGASEGIYDFAKEALTMISTEDAGVGSETLEFLGGAASRVVSGATRFADPINQIVAATTDTFDNPDRRQGYEALNNMGRYIDQVLDISGAIEPREERYAPFNEPKDQDLGRLTGNRQSQPPSVSEKMLASMGKSPWKAVRWPGDSPELKNAMDRIIEPIINGYAQGVIDEDPEFYSRSQAAKEAIWSNKVLKPAKKDTVEIIHSQISTDPKMSHILTISGYSQKELRRAREFWGYDGNISDLNETQLEALIEYLQNQEDYLDLQ